MRPLVYPHPDEPLYAVRVDEASVRRARAAIRAEYQTGLPLRYLGIRVVNLPEDDEHKGRRRRAHIFTDKPA